MTENNIEYLMREDQGSLGFNQLASRISTEPHLLPVTGQSLGESFDQGLAMAMVVQETPVGYIRFEPLLTTEFRQRLELALEIPSIWEMGTVYLAPEYRGRNLYPGFNNTFLNRFRDRFDSEELLVIGTTKTPAYLRVLDHAREVGIDFQRSNHLEYGMVAAFTCICSGDFGRGLHLGDGCPSRVEPTQLQMVSDVIAQKSATTIPCTMFVSSRDLAARTDARLIEHFNPGPRSPDGDLLARRQLVRALMRERYYPSNE